MLYKLKRIFIAAIVMIFSSSCLALRADINGDGRVDLQDFIILSEEWLMGELGTEIIQNGSFTGTVTEWTIDGGGGWLLEDGVAKFVGAGGVGDPIQPLAHGTLTQVFLSPLQVGRVYRLTFSVATMTDYKLKLTVDGIYNLVQYGNGTHTIDFVATAAATGIRFDGFYSMSTTLDIEIDNVSLREISTGDDLILDGDFTESNDWDAGTDWTIQTLEVPPYAEFVGPDHAGENTLSQTLTLDAEKTYVLILEASAETGVNLSVLVGSDEVVSIVGDDTSVSRFVYFKPKGNSILTFAATGEAGKYVWLDRVFLFESRLTLSTRKLRVIQIEPSFQGHVIIRRQGCSKF